VARKSALEKLMPERMSDRWTMPGPPKTWACRVLVNSKYVKVKKHTHLPRSPGDEIECAESEPLGLVGSRKLAFFMEGGASRR
jgi:hypothetical protein